jgi:hypothetical protein|tara:strand:+ start:931 stop:1584 length:654 start_codon:yes stop_codon:yes gene_type:complete
MATPKYFQPFPNIEYATSVNSAGKSNTVSIKDFFHLLRVRDDIYKNDTIYQEYVVKNGERPDQISFNWYGDEQYYWIILQINDIVDYYNEWPLSDFEFEQFLIDKYGTAENAGQIHHYETFEVKDSNDTVLLQRGLTVTEDFVFTYKPDPYVNVYATSTPYAVSNREYEKILNDQKGVIQMLQPKYVWDYSREIYNYAKNLEPQKSFVDLSSRLIAY